MPVDSLGLSYSGVEEAPRHEYCKDLVGRASEAVRKSRQYFFKNQHSDGYWWFELESNVTITAEYLMLLTFAGIEDKERSGKMANHILRRQRPDGTWAVHHGGRGDISTSVEAYFALKLAGYSAEDSRLEKARRFILANGGLAETRFFTKVFLALFGQYDWKIVPSVPVEIVLLPSWVPVNIYSFSSWARATFVPLSVVLDKKPVKAIPEARGVRELTGAGLAREPHNGACPFLSWKQIFMLIDRFMKATEESPLRRLRRKGLDRAMHWVLEHQEPTGEWGGIQPAMVNSILALLASGHDTSSEPVRKGFEGLEKYVIEQDGELQLQSCISPVWDTALTGLALAHSGLKASHPVLTGACRWLTERQIFSKGDWSVKRPSVEPGGWAFEFLNTRYPDIDDTAVVLMLLNTCGLHRFLRPQNLEKAVAWILAMQGRDGGWGAFDVDNNMKLLNKTPFGDLEAMIDPSTPDITGRVLELLGALHYPLSSKPVERAFRFLKKMQEKDGLWWGRWGVNYIYGTWSVLAGLQSIGEDMTKPYIRKAVETLKLYQNPDGGWGECCESYANPGLRACGSTTPSQTAWVLMALMAAGERTCREMLDGIKFLLKSQEPDGTWQEDAHTATGFPKHFMIKYHNYRNCFPLMALGKFLAADWKPPLIRALEER